MSKRTKKFAKVNKNFMIVAIDIGKDTNYGYCRSSNGNEIRSFPFSNTRTGFDKLWSTIIIAKTKMKIDNIFIGYESTGSYGVPLVHYLYKKPVTLMQVNPMHTKRVKELSDNSPLKNDKKDPHVIADLMELGHYLSVIVPEGAAADLRHLAHARERAVHDLTVMRNRTQQLVHQIFPEYLTIMHGLESVSSHYILRHYPTPDSLVQLGHTRLTRILERVSRKQLGVERARQLCTAAERSVGITEGRISILMEIHHYLIQIATTDAFIAQLEGDMKKHFKTVSYSQNLLSIPGVGIITVATFLGEVGNIKELHNYRSIMKLAGLNLFEVSSGKHKGERHITKRGRSLLRKSLYMASINLIRKNGFMYSYYHMLLDRGKTNKQALVAVSRKLLRIMFSLGRRNTDYDHKYVVKHAA